MIDLTNYKILKYQYEFSTEELESKVWDNMTEEEVKWAVRITLEGINDTAGITESRAWDLFFLNEELETQIETILKKYDVSYVKENLTENLLTNPNEVFTDYFMERLNEFLTDNLDVDSILDRILDVGVDKLTSFEKYFLNKDTEN
jgi:hypothetical protein